MPRRHVRNHERIGKGEPLLFLSSSHIPSYTSSIDQTPNHFGLQYSDGGAVVLDQRGETYRMRGRWLWMTRPGLTSRYRPDARPGYWDHHFVTFVGPLAEEWDREDILITTPQPAPPTMDAATHIERIRHLTDAGGPEDNRLARVLLEALFLELARARREQAEKPVWLKQVWAALEEPALEAPDYDGLAAELNMSDRHLRRLFRKQTGVSMHRYYMQRRIARARVLLQRTDLPVKVVAHELGFADVYYFSRQFKAICGVPPGRFRTSRRG